MKIRYAFTTILICMFLYTPVAKAGETSLINTSEFGQKQRPAAVFDHDRHIDITGENACTVCHHFYENGSLVNGESSEGMFCSDCHNSEIQKGKTHLTRAFHNRCKGCHIDKKAGPVLCADCHINE